MLDEFDYGCADGSVGCALPDLRYVVALVLGAAVVAAALGIALARKLRHVQARAVNQIRKALSDASYGAGVGI